MSTVLEFRVTEDDRDPMEEPGMGCCGECGMYPLAEDEQHDCRP